MLDALARLGVLDRKLGAWLPIAVLDHFGKGVRKLYFSAELDEDGELLTRFAYEPIEEAHTYVVVDLPALIAHADARLRGVRPDLMGEAR